jgi:hypothetical protein
MRWTGAGAAETTAAEANAMKMVDFMFVGGRLRMEEPW